VRISSAGFGGRVLAHRREEGAEAPSQDVLEGAGALLLDHLVEDLPESVDREGLRAGLPGREGNDAGTLDERAHPAYG